MKTNLVCLAFVVSIAFSNCNLSGPTVNGNGNVTTENRHVSSAQKIKSLGDMDVFISSGSPGVKVVAEDNLLPYIITESNGEWLTVKTRNNVNIHTNSPIKVYVTMPDISDLEVNGSGNITCNDKFSSHDNMFFRIAGSGDMILNVNAPGIHTEIAGSGNMHIKGETRNLEVSIAGSGDYDGQELKAENADVNIAGSGNANLFADANLKASVVGSGDVKYSGDAVVDKHIVGSGTVIKVP